MSQTVVPAPPGQAGPPAQPSQPSHSGLPGQPSAQSQANWVVHAVRAAFRGTPGRLRLIALAVVFGCLIAGFGGAFALRDRSSSLAQARSTTQHLIQLQRVQTNLLQADALITNTFLQGGLENISQLQRYYAAVDAATADLAGAARASDADASALAAANTALARYTGLVEAARANNRQGLPVGATYLSTASAQLKDDVITPVAKRATADSKSIDSALSGASRATLWLVLAVVLGLGLLVWGQYELAQRSRRVINLPAAAATAVMVMMLIVATVAMVAVAHRANDTQRGAFGDTTALSTARVAAFQAKATESRGLVNRGSGAATNTGWLDQIGRAGVLPESAAAARTPLEKYTKLHQSVREADDAGDWDAAVKIATRTGDGSINAAFDQYSQLTQEALDRSAAETASGLDPGPWLTVLAVLLVLAGIGAAIVGWFGVSLRMGEYR